MARRPPKVRAGRVTVPLIRARGGLMPIIVSAKRVVGPGTPPPAGLVPSDSLTPGDALTPEG